ENVGKIRYKQVGHNQANFGWDKFPTRLGDILPLLDRGKDRGIGRRPSDAALFQLLHQRRFVVAWRRLGKVLFRLQFTQRELLADLQRRQLVFKFLVFLV